MSKNTESAGPLGGWLGTIGAGFGIYSGLYIAGASDLESGPTLVAVVIMMLIGAWVGLVVERIVAFFLMLAIAVIMFLARQHMLEIIFS